MTENELYHHGILGQKWGVRRYQNKDGSYTSAGRARYSVKGTAHRVAAKVFDINAKYYDKHGNKTMASMNKAARNDHLKKAEAADANAKGIKLSENQKKALKVGVAVAGTALAVYGAYKVGSLIKSKNVASIRSAEEFVRRSMEKSLGLSSNDRIPGTGLYVNRNSPEPDYDTFKPDTFKPDTFKPDTFKPDTFQESILEARRNGVPENEILKTKKDIDDYFNPQTIGDTAGNMLRARDRGDSIVDYMNSKHAKADSAYSKARHKATQDFIKSVENARSAGVPEDQIVKTVSEANDYFTIGKKNRDKK